MFNVTNLNRFLLVVFLACNAFYFNLPYKRFTHITLLTQSKRLIPTIIHCSLYTESSFVYGCLQPKWPLVLRSLQLPHAFYTSMYLEIIAVLQYNNHDGVFHACALKSVWKSLYFIKVQPLAVRVALAPSSVYSILPPRIHPGLLSCACVFFSLYCAAC